MAKRKSLAVPASGQLQDLMEFVEFINKFRAIKRTLWFAGVEGPERNGEHSYQLDQVARYLNSRWKLGFNPLRLSEYAKDHDLIETFADETPAFPDLFGELPAPSRCTKKRREHESLLRIEREWGKKFPALVNSINEYERQENEESRFIYALDKLIATINIYQEGGRTYRRVGATFNAIDKYQTPRVKRHKAVQALYDEMRRLLRKHESKLFPPKVLDDGHS